MGKSQIHELRTYYMPQNFHQATQAQQHTGLVLFYCTILALKAEDSVNRTTGTVDDVINGEMEYFRGYEMIVMSQYLLRLGRLILDDQYEHVLRLFKDKDSGVVRLQASVRSGKLKKS